MRIRQLLLLLAGILFSFAGAAQNSGYDQLQRGYITLGINGGSSYQTSDVKARCNGYGLGLTLGKNLYYHPASPITADIRARFLYARQYGLDGTRSFDIEDNVGLNGTRDLDYLNPPAQGFVYHNYRTTLGELAAELALTWNTNRLGPGLFFSLFGGAGIDYFQTRIDQADATGAEYHEAYAALEGKKANIRRELKNSILDGNYETIPDNFRGTGQANFVPSLGLEAGIQLSPRFAVSIGHRITFSGNNLLDGHQWEDSKGDWYHYTNLGLHWTIYSRAKKTTRGNAPQISIIVPSQRPYTSNTSAGLVKARITNVQSAADVYCAVNGQRMPFDFYGGDLALSFPLARGRNDINIQATNPYGKDLETVVIFYQTGTGYDPPTKPIPNPNPNQYPNPNPTPAPPAPIPPPSSGAKPAVRIDQPANQSTTEKSTAAVRANLKNVSNASDITYLANGQKVTAFDYEKSTGMLTYTQPLKEGNNTITIKGTNKNGSAEATVVVIYNKPAPPPPPKPKPPRVTITQPLDNAVVSQPSTVLKASIVNISRKDQITFWVNNSTTGNFTFSNGQFQATAPLRDGENTLVIKVQNDDGKAEDAVRVTYRIPTRPKPEVQFTIPAKPGATATRVPYQVRATVLEVDKPGDIQFKVNGKETGGFQFDPKTGVFNAEITPAAGRNDLEITATNRSGSATAKTYINYSKPVEKPKDEKPVVKITSITQPASNPLNPNVATSKMEAVISRIDRKEQILLTINGTPVSDFTFTPGTGAFTTTLILNRGSNVIVLKATNRAGSDEESRTIDF